MFWSLCFCSLKRCAVDAKNWWLYKFFPKQKSENIVKHFSLTEDLKTLSTMLIESKKR